MSDAGEGRQELNRRAKRDVIVDAAAIQVLYHSAETAVFSRRQRGWRQASVAVVFQDLNIRHRERREAKLRRTELVGGCPGHTLSRTHTAAKKGI